MKKGSKCLCIILSLVLAVTLTCSTTFATVNEEKNKLSDLNKQKQENQDQKNELESSKSEAEQYIKAVDKQLTDLASDIYNTEKELDKTEEKIKKTKKQLSAAQESIDEQYADMKLRIQYIYENGDTQMLDLILNSESFSDFLNKAEYITELSQYDRKMLNKMKKTKEKIETAKSTLETSKKSLVTMQNQQKTDKEKLEKLSESKQKELESYKTLIADNQDAEDALEQEISAQESKVAVAEQASKKAAEEASKRAAEQASKAAAERQRIADAKKNTEQQANEEQNNIINNSQSTTPSTPSVSGFIWPCPGYTTVSSDFGYRSDPFTGKTTYHSGIDIPAPSGTPIVASASGTVAWSNMNATAGNWVGINHGNGVYTVYMHMSVRLVAEGATVSQGQTIGLVGTTGSSTGNHLHFSVRQNGGYVSPWNYISK